MIGASATSFPELRLIKRHVIFANPLSSEPTLQNARSFQSIVLRSPRQSRAIVCIATLKTVCSIPLADLMHLFRLIGAFRSIP